MSEITKSLVKELRERTGFGIIDCKKALTEANGDIELAIENMRKSSKIKVAKKASQIINAGTIITKIDGEYSVILEVNCQTDFVAKNNYFQIFAKKVIDTAINSRINNIEILRDSFKEERIALINKIGEYISIRRLAVLEGKVLGSYQHGMRIGVLVAAINASKNLIKQIAMHVAANKPEFIRPEDIPPNVIEKEYQIQLEIAMRSNKHKAIVDKIVEGRMKKFINEVSLTGQLFVMNQSQSIEQLLKEHNADITGFIRFELGEETNKS